MSSHYANTAREQAQHILSHPPYVAATSHTPRPFAGVLTWIGHALRFVFGGFFAWIYHHLLVHVGHGFHFVFGSWWPVAAGAVAIVVGVALAMLVMRRRSRVERRIARNDGAAAPIDDADDLRRAAEEAAQRSDFETSVRLWFRWGVRRLTETGVVANAPAQTDRQLIMALHSPAFTDVQLRHERIVYGRVVATRDDADASRDGWSDVVREARSARRRDHGEVTV